jgi:cobalt-zinc-cadmium resistance protein CzcA
LNVDLKGAELVKKVSEVFYLILYMQQKQSILLQNDSIFAEFLFRANIRFIQGESNILEKTTAESQRGQVLVQLNQLKNDMEILQLQFSLLLNTSTVYIPTAENPKMLYNAILDTATIKNHLQIKLLQQEIETATFVKKLERNKLLPDLNFGFNTMSIKGSNPENIEYSKNYQFHSVQFGISFPLIYFSQKAKINAAQIQLQISQNNFLSGIESYNFQYVSAFMKYRTNIETVKYFENTGLKIAETITSTANQQYINGDINFLEWTILINNANSIKSDYIDSIKELNQIIIQLNFLSTK